MVKESLKTILAAAFLVGGCQSTSINSSDLAGQGGEQLSGAIFTTEFDGTTVDANIYDEKCDVYLNGGPARDGSAGLPEGDYYFMVTGPSGSDESGTLLSTDDISARQVHVDASGRFTGVSGAGNHKTSTNEVDGGMAIQLCPFATTPNPGCEYKVWLTPVEEYSTDDLGGVFGFSHSASKTDNFHIVCGGGGTDEDGNQL